jgi:hypothetical protein
MSRFLLLNEDERRESLFNERKKDDVKNRKRKDKKPRRIHRFFTELRRSSTAT